MKVSLLPHLLEVWYSYYYYYHSKVIHVVCKLRTTTNIKREKYLSYKKD